MANQSSWFPVSIFKKEYEGNGISVCDNNVLFGPCLQNERTSYLYENEFIKKHSTVIWNPDLHITVSLVSYEKAHQTNDIKALGKLTKAGIPLYCTFGGTVKLNS